MLYTPVVPRPRALPEDTARTEYIIYPRGTNQSHAYISLCDVRISKENKIFVLPSITFHVHDQLEKRHSAYPHSQWDLHVMTSDGKHVLLSVANLP